MVEKIDERKQKILKAILEAGEISVAEIQRKTGIPRSSLNHHLSILNREIIFQRRTGKEILNKINPKLVQVLRKKFNLRAKKMLTSGYTYDPKKPDLKTLEVLQRALSFLKKEGIEVEKSVAFTTPLAKEKIRETKYKRGDEEVALEFDVYQSEIEEMRKRIRELIESNISSCEILIDLTPLTKLFSIVALSLAREYGLRAFYHAGDKLVWL